jgi:hypothetical protein
VLLRPAQHLSDFSIYTFDNIAPEEIFKYFVPVPQLWGEIRIPQIASQPPSLQYYSARRMRPSQSPLGGWNEWKNSHAEWETDQFQLCSGIFKESALAPRRYIIDCIVELTIGIRPTEPAAGRGFRSNLRYTGPAHGIMVFSRPIDDDLVQLVIIDLRP